MQYDQVTIFDCLCFTLNFHDLISYFFGEASACEGYELSDTWKLLYAA